MAPLLAWANGHVVPLADARVPLVDEGVLRGDGCFEAVRVYDGRPFALDEHLARMGRSASLMRLPTTGVSEAFAALCPGFDGYVRVLVTRGPPPAVYGLQELARVFTRPARLRSLCAPWLVPLGSTPLAGAKTLSYAHNMAARRCAEEEGYDDSLLIAADGSVLEGPNWSVMWVEGGAILTPPLELGILDSITRRVLMQRCAEVTECTADLERVLAADEVFIVSTGHEVHGVGEIDGRLWNAPGAVTSELASRFGEFVRTGSSTAPGP
ncbi:MAG: branched-chain amino acid aminotransferase [Solirubrobacteraceae bacterium]|nr:branched-chain amino acid aminotransferase [Solirubrobacteraceae bacterium]